MIAEVLRFWWDVFAPGVPASAYLSAAACVSTQGVLVTRVRQHDESDANPVICVRLIVYLATKRSTAQ